MLKSLKLLKVSLLASCLMVSVQGMSSETTSQVSRSPASAAHSVLTSEYLRNPVSNHAIADDFAPKARRRRVYVPEVGPVRIDPTGSVPRSFSGTLTRFDNFRAF
jgi:hypothetical protein